MWSYSQIFKKAPQDFILSNGKAYTIKQMLKFAFGYFNLNYRNYVIVRFNKLKQNEVKIKKSDFKNLFKKNNIKFKSKIFGKKLIYKMIKYYLNGKKFNKYFIYYLSLLFFFSIVYLFQKHTVGNDSTISEWLINYQGGFTKRGLIGQLSIF